MTLVCRWCNELLVRRRERDGSLEQAAEFGRRRFCGASHYERWRREKEAALRAEDTLGERECLVCKRPSVGSKCRDCRASYAKARELAIKAGTWSPTWRHLDASPNRPCCNCGQAPRGRTKSGAERSRCDACHAQITRVSKEERKRRSTVRAERRRRRWVSEGFRRERNAAFWALVDKSDAEGCWLWTGRMQRVTGDPGYPRFNFGGRVYAGHRLALEISLGHDLGQFNALHTCDNKRCVRPDHLFEGTHADNMADFSAKRRVGLAAISAARDAGLSVEDLLEAARALKAQRSDKA